MGLNHRVQSAIDKWADQQAIDLSPLISNPIANQNSFKSAAISIVQAPETKKYHELLANVIVVAPAVIKELVVHLQSSQLTQLLNL